MKYILIVISFLVIGYSAYLAKDLSSLQKEQTNLKNDHASINRINYGLFNMQLWKEQTLSIFEDRIQNFNIDPKVYKEVEAQLNVYLLQVYKDYFESGKLVETFLESQQKDGSKVNKFILKMVKDNIGPAIESFDIKSKIPSISKELSKELKKNEPVLKGYLREELNKMIFTGGDKKYKDPRESVYEKYALDNLESTTALLKEKIEFNELSINKLLRRIYMSLIFILIVIIACSKWIGYQGVILLFTLISVLLLVLGVSLPMIDIDARLNNFQMDVLGNTISFDEQFLYYQSKSIIDVTQTLISSRGIDIKIVGWMILLFSVVFPFIKLLLSSGYIFSPALQRNKIVEGIIFYLGKWSMADVFVVAMFMAYIGFYGLVTSQLGEIGRNETGFAVETLNYSRLSPGALFFTSYCVLSIITSTIIARRAKGTEEA